MRERFSGGSGNRKGDLKPPKTNSFPAHSPVEEPIIQNSNVPKLSKFVPLGLSIEPTGLQDVRSYINNVGCPPTPGHIVTPIVKEPVKKHQRIRNSGEIYGGTSKKSLRSAREKAKRTNRRESQ